jgi:hypothetical protein
MAETLRTGLQNPSGSGLNSAKHRPGFEAGTPFKTKNSRNRKAENKSNALPLLFSALRRTMRKPQQRNKTGCTCITCIFISN